MPTILVTHDVVDTQRWLAAPAREAFFGSLGITNIRTFSNPRNPKQVGLTMEVPDVDAVVSALGTSAAAEAMKDDGVIADSVTLLVETS
ncbi:MAG: hypothetical protein AB7G37_14005 [Solirubrobacteraceae bacterium]